LEAEALLRYYIPFTFVLVRDGSVLYCFSSSLRQLGEGGLFERRRDRDEVDVIRGAQLVKLHWQRGDRVGYDILPPQAVPAVAPISLSHKKIAHSCTM
jgi:hypothetical protein